MKTNNINFSVFKAVWAVVITIGVFAGTLYTTQSVSNTKISFLEGEVAGLKLDISELAREVSEVKSSQSIALADISQKLHAMELQLRELQVTLFILVDSYKDNLLKNEIRSTSQSINPDI